LNAIRAAGDCIFGVGPKTRILRKIAGEERFKATVDPNTSILKVGFGGDKQNLSVGFGGFNMLAPCGV